ncbi:MAG: hypothetical protein CL678_01195 [Bdellovibrionaceae bacterium]|nr:hypothetical protein [Pseudobdellovibrionaceae bacterium]
MWLSVPAGGLVIVSYGLIYCLSAAENGLNIAKEGLYRTYPKLLKAFWVITATAYLYLYALCAHNADAINNDLMRFAILLFTWFPLSAMAWALAVWDDTTETNGIACVRVTAALSLGFVLLAGRISDEYVWLQWIAVGVIVIQHVVIDAIVWVRMLEQREPFNAHAYAAMVHIGSAVAIYIYGMEKSNYETRFYQFPVKLDDISDFDPYRWQYVCRNQTLSTCGDDDKNFSIEGRYDHNLYVHTLVLTSAFAAWSGFWHVVAAGTSPDVARKIKWIDYAGSAPMMLIVISLQYGHHKLSGIVIAPIVLGLLILWAGQKRESPNGVPPAWFLMSLAIYALVWVPSGHTFNLSFGKAQEPVITETEISPGLGEPPKFVWAFYAITVALFSSFPVVYALQIWHALDENTEEKAYIGLSLIAKLTLHLYIGLTVIASAGTLDETKITTMDTLLPGLIGTGVIVFFVSFLVRYAKLDEPWPKYTVVYNQAQGVYEGFLMVETKTAKLPGAFLQISAVA